MQSSHGITLVALVVSIVVMLVLAGVSINAVVGDNGIITQAQSATYATSRAVLEEWLNQLYVENYDDFSEYDNKLDGFLESTTYSEYFYNPKRDGDGDGSTSTYSLTYVIDNNDHVLYLIKKSALPDEIRNQLAGGDAGDGSYASYQQLIDVYGVTSDLKVYYCSNGTDTILGASEEELDNDDPNRTVKLSDSLANLLGTNTNITAQDLKSIDTLTINSESTLTSLSELYNLTSLKKLTLDNVALSLDGLQNCTQLTQLYFQNYTSDTITNYTSLAKLTKLKYLYLIASCDAQVTSVFSAMSSTDYSQLQYLGVYDGTTNVTDISAMANLTTATKQAVNYLYLYNNNLTSITSVAGFSNVTILYVYTNANLTTLAGVSPMSNLIYLYAYNCGLCDDDENGNYALSELYQKSGLEYVDLKNNTSLQYLEGLSKSPISKMFYLAGCSSLLGSQVTLIADIYNSCSTKKSIDDEFTQYLSSDTIIYLNDSSLADDSDEIKSLLNMTDTNKSKVLAVRLQNNPNLSNDVLNEILSGFTNLQSVNLNGCTGLSTLDFVKNTPNLVELLFKDTSVTEVSLLDTYLSNLKCIECNNSRN